MYSLRQYLFQIGSNVTEFTVPTVAYFAYRKGESLSVSLSWSDGTNNEACITIVYYLKKLINIFSDKLLPVFSWKFVSSAQQLFTYSSTGLRDLLFRFITPAASGTGTEEWSAPVSYVEFIFILDSMFWMFV